MPHEVFAVGDRRYDPVFQRVRDSADRAAEIRSLSHEDVIAALAGATHHADPLLANILATEAQNRALRASEVTAALGEGVLVMDAQWRIAMQNPAAERMLGWTSAECIGHDPHALLHPFCNEMGRCPLGGLPAADLFHQDDDALVARADGATIRVAYTVTPMLRGEIVTGGVVILRDSSERKRLEEKIIERQDRLERVLQTLPAGVLIVGLDGRITYANAAAERILGRALRDIKERPYFDPGWSFTTPLGEPMPVTDLPFLEVLATGEASLARRLGVRAGDGSIAQLSVETIPLPNASGEQEGLLVTFRETSSRTT